MARWLLNILIISSRHLISLSSQQETSLRPWYCLPSISFTRFLTRRGNKLLGGFQRIST
ncbi:unnamed protein product [Brassica oleracea var. botrytis]